jgi:hypothetical protein
MGFGPHNISYFHFIHWHLNFHLLWIVQRLIPNISWMVDLTKRYIMKLLSTIKFWFFIINLTILAKSFGKSAKFSISKN